MHQIEDHPEENATKYPKPRHNWNRTSVGGCPGWTKQNSLVEAGLGPVRRQGWQIRPPKLKQVEGTHASSEGLDLKYYFKCLNAKHNKASLSALRHQVSLISQHILRPRLLPRLLHPLLPLLLHLK